MGQLHITNGDSAAEILRASSVSGEVLPWRDPMHHGPFPADLSLAALRPIRAKYLSGPGGDTDAIARDIQARDDALVAAQTDGVVLWFEHDLLDQMQLLQILDWFATARRDSPRPEIICIDRFPGVTGFRGLGQLSPVQMASLFERRAAVTEAMLSLAQAGWAAFRATDPTRLQDFMSGDLSDLPFLKAALLRHLEEYPATQTGLTRTETQLLSLVADGVRDPVALFQRNMDQETVLFIGDWRSYSILDRLCQADLLTSETGTFWHPPKSVSEVAAFRAQRLTLTERGNAVMSGNVHGRAVLPRDEWLGGVRLAPGNPTWTWDAVHQTLVRCTH